MAEDRCKYCGGKLPKYTKICATCYEKLKLIRKIKAMLEPLKKAEVQE